MSKPIPFSAITTTLNKISNDAVETNKKSNGALRIQAKVEIVGNYTIDKDGEVKIDASASGPVPVSGMPVNAGAKTLWWRKRGSDSDGTMKLTWELDWHETRET